MDRSTTRFAFACLIAAGAAQADPSVRLPSSMAVEFEDCTAFAGLGPIAAARIEGRLPAGYTAAALDPGHAGIVARVARCERISVDGKPAGRATVSHVGISLVAPDGTGDTNVYTLVYVTDSDLLAQQLRRFGLPAFHDPGIVYEVDPSAGALELFARVEAGPGATYFLHGVETDAPPGAFPFLSNWWYSSRQGRLKMATAIPTLSTGSADVALYTPLASPLGQLLGATRTTFPLLSFRGVFPNAVMTMTLER